MELNLLFNKNFAGRYAYTSNLYNYDPYYIDGRWVMSGVKATTDIADNPGIMLILLTGWYVNLNGSTFYQYLDFSKEIAPGVWELPSVSYIKYDSSFELTEDTDTAYKDGQYLVNEIIKNNKRILENNLICSRYASKLNSEQRELLYELQNRLDIRNKALLNKGLISSAKTAAPKGYANEVSYLNDFMANPKIGVVLSGTATIVISAIVIASMSVAAYFAYVAYYKESMDDVKYSDELTAILADKLTPEELQMLKDETAGIVTKARLTSSVGSFGNLLKWAAYGFAAYTLYKLIAPKAKSAYNNYKNKEK